MVTYTFKRYALVSLRNDSVETIERYLPGNYSVAGTVELTVDESLLLNGKYAVIEGRDKSGWTLDDYVIPRLASGLIVATEISLDCIISK